VSQCVEALGWEQAFSCSSYSYLPGLTQTGATIDWLLSQLANQESRQYMTAAQAKNAVKASVCRCDPLVLRERIPTLRSLSDFTELERQTIAERIELASVCPEELWSRLESLFRDQDETG